MKELEKLIEEYTKLDEAEQMLEAGEVLKQLKELQDFLDNKDNKQWNY